jgi:hypothetical protein
MKRHLFPLRATARQRGQALVEFAASIIFLSFLLLGVIEFGMLLYNYIVVVDAIDEAAAYATIYPYERDLAPNCTSPCRIDNDEDIIQRLHDTSAANSIIQESAYLTITIFPDYLHRQACSNVTVEAFYGHRFMFPLFGQGLNLHYQAVKMIAPPGAIGICPVQP